jgi:hypothetical protein
LLQAVLISAGSGGNRSHGLPMQCLRQA